MKNKYLGQIVYVIKKANKDVWGKDGYILETGQPLGKFFKTLKLAENYCVDKANKFKLQIIEIKKP